MTMYRSQKEILTKLSDQKHLKVTIKFRNASIHSKAITHRFLTKLTQISFLKKGEPIFRTAQK